MRRAVRTALVMMCLAASVALPAGAEVRQNELQPTLVAVHSSRSVSVSAELKSDFAVEREPLVPPSGTGTGLKPGQCAKWRAMAHQLGETFAGHALRESVLKRVCVGLTSERYDDVWDWPWSRFAAGHLLPPRTHRWTDAWQIRCGLAPKRHRCALLHLAALPDRDPNEVSAFVIAHVVIDMVAGRETVLWRVFVPQPEQDGRGARLDAKSDVLGPTTAVIPARDRPALKYQAGGQEFADKYVACAPMGCIAEATLRHAALVVSGLIDGLPIDLRVEGHAGVERSVRVPSRGFRAGFAELIRLRREELRSERR